jgi:hypothetical protein
MGNLRLTFVFFINFVIYYIRKWMQFVFHLYNVITYKRVTSGVCIHMSLKKDGKKRGKWLLSTTICVSFFGSAHRFNTSYQQKLTSAAMCYLWISWMHPPLNWNLSKEGNFWFYFRHGAYAGITPHCRSCRSCRSVSQPSTLSGNACGLHWRDKR